ncbi:MAG: SCP2 sterol-binding domain-containing protein [Coxiellaceae bacterium]|nr:SCP2 sterol-binding domain-containing protein [Coxiellaceae bacterium]
MILALLLPALESIINRALQCDPDALTKLSSIKNQVIKIHCTDWKVSFFIVIDSNGLQFHTKYFSQENTLIKSTGNNFLHVFIKGADTQTLFDYPMDISGNTHNLEVLREVFKNLDLDLEEKLSQIVGDVAAHKLFAHAHNVKSILKDTSEKLSDQAKEYLYFEAKHFPTQKQVEKFYKDIARLRDDVARLEARINAM